MEKLIILDYSTTEVHIYDLDREDPISDEDIEKLGFNSNDCYWMVGNVELTYHKETVK